MIKYIMALLLVVAVSYFLWKPRLAREFAPVSSPPRVVDVKLAQPPVSARELIHHLAQVPPPPVRAYKGYDLNGPAEFRLELSAEHKYFRFKDDESAIVLQDAQGNIIYLREVPTPKAFPPEFHTLAGWRVYKKRVSRLVLIQDVHASFPRVESLIEAAPPDLQY